MKCLPFGIGGYGLNRGLGRPYGYGRRHHHSYGQGYGRQRINQGSTGFSNSDQQSAGYNNYHNIGQHHNKATVWVQPCSSE
ncbi:unnamed protein product [Leptidea sinapis]|uniref:Uncharacterized protein n=1 Tax=Leptidea sinapis TaxID=189913 RepID=A0A5E4PW60_9NEOP|nr:unnamed protein product [Leptidea sinapis]